MKRSASTQGFETIFASYARADLGVVEEVASIVEGMGFAQLRWDVRILRSGDDWRQRVRDEIEGADSFQLFWSQNAADSVEVEKEWKHAHQLDRSGFIKPVYWKDPIPAPPTELAGLHFSRIRIDGQP